MHSLIVGTTESGKTTLAKKLANKHAGKNFPVIVLTSVWEQWGNGIQVFDDQDEFLATFWAMNRKAFAFIDEGKNFLAKFNDAMELTATQGRQWGWSCYYIAQRATMISPDIRGNCSQLFCFAQGSVDAKTLSEEFVQEGLLEAPNLKKGEFFLVRRFSESGEKFIQKLNSFTF